MPRLIPRLCRALSIAGFAGAAGACSTPEPKAPPSPQPLPHDIVARAARPFHGLSGGERLTGDALNVQLKSQRAICVGESHDNPIHHYLQARVLSLLVSHAASLGEPFGAGFEMFQGPFQEPLRAFQEKRLTEAQLLQQSEYDKRWGYDFSLYRPLLETARDNGAALLALNAPREWTKALARKGIAKAETDLRTKLPELVLDDLEHQQFFRTAMSGHPGPTGAKPPAKKKTLSPKLERFYQAQVLWDEHMAQTAASWLKSQSANARVIVFAGSGHCHHSAIPRRFQRRTQVPMLSVRPIAKSELGRSSAPRDDQFDLLLVYEADRAKPPPALED